MNVYACRRMRLRPVLFIHLCAPVRLHVCATERCLLSVRPHLHTRVRRCLHASARVQQGAGVQIQRARAGNHKQTPSVAAGPEGTHDMQWARTHTYAQQVRLRATPFPDHRVPNYITERDGRLQSIDSAA